MELYDNDYIRAKIELYALENGFTFAQAVAYFILLGISVHPYLTVLRGGSLIQNISSEYLQKGN